MLMQKLRENLEKELQISVSLESESCNEEYFGDVFDLDFDSYFKLSQNILHDEVLLSRRRNLPEFIITCRKGYPTTAPSSQPV